MSSSCFPCSNARAGTADLDLTRHLASGESLFQPGDLLQRGGISNCSLDGCFLRKRGFCWLLRNAILARSTRLGSLLCCRHCICSCQALSRLKRLLCRSQRCIAGPAKRLLCRIALLCSSMLLTERQGCGTHDASHYKIRIGHRAQELMQLESIDWGPATCTQDYTWKTYACKQYSRESANRPQWTASVFVCMAALVSAVEAGKSTQKHWACSHRCCQAKDCYHQTDVGCSPFA